MIIKEQKQNLLFKRKEVSFVVSGAGATPSRKEVRKALAEKVGVNEKLVVIDKIDQRYGTTNVNGTARVYQDEKALAVEKKHKIARDEGTKSKAKKEGAAAAPAEKK